MARCALALITGVKTSAPHFSSLEDLNKNGLLAKEKSAWSRWYQRTAPSAAKEGVTWGPVVNGLQAGLSAGRAEVGPGKPLKVVVHVRNVGVAKRVLKGAASTYPFHWGCSVLTGDGRVCWNPDHSLFSPYQAKDLTLAPGEAWHMALDYDRPYRWRDSVSGSLTKSFELPAGKYSVSCSYGDGDLKLVTGALSVRVADSEELTLVGAVQTVKPSPLDPPARKNFVITTKVAKVLSGRFGGRTFSFRVHSPARSGMEVGKEYVLRAERTAAGWQLISHESVDRYVGLSALPGTSGGGYRAGPYMRAAARLQALGREVACRALLRGATGCRDNQLVVLCRMLFEARPGKGFRRARLGAGAFLGGTAASDWPLEPIHLVDGVPFLIVRGYNVSGFPEQQGTYLRYCMANCDWRNRRYVVADTKRKSRALAALIASGKWKKLSARDRVCLAAQIGAGKDAAVTGLTADERRLLARLNGWDEEELDVAERPAVHRAKGRLASGETNGWISVHKGALKARGIDVTWDHKKRRYIVAKVSRPLPPAVAVYGNGNLINGAITPAVTDPIISLEQAGQAFSRRSLREVAGLIGPGAYVKTGREYTLYWRVQGGGLLIVPKYSPGQELDKWPGGGLELYDSGRVLKRRRAGGGPEAASGASGGSAPAKFNPADWTAVAAVGGTDRITQEHLTNLLKSKGIESLMEGSIAYGLSVRKADATRAIKILRADAARGHYWIVIYDGDRRKEHKVKAKWRSWKPGLRLDRIQKLSRLPVKGTEKERSRFAVACMAALRSGEVAEAARGLPVVSQVRWLRRPCIGKGGEEGFGYDFVIELAAGAGAEGEGARFRLQVWDSGRKLQQQGSSGWKKGAASDEGAKHFMGLADDAERRIEDENPDVDHRLRGIVTVTRVEEVPYAFFEKLDRGKVLQVQRRKGFVYFAVRESRNVPFAGGGSAMVPVTRRYRAAVKRPVVSWGKPVDGLQAGLVAGRASFAAGKTLDFSIHVKNLTDKRHSLLTAPAPEGWWLYLQFQKSTKAVAIRPVQQGDRESLLNYVDPGKTVRFDVSVPVRGGARALRSGVHSVSATYTHEKHAQGGKCATWHGSISTGSVSIRIARGTAAPAEKPAGVPEVPAGKRGNMRVPKDLDDCFVQLMRLLKPADVERIKKGTEKDMARYHFSLGLWMRNNWRLWGGSRLAKWFHARGIHHPDDMSGTVLTSFWRHLNRKPIRLGEQAKYYQDYWKKQSTLKAGMSRADACKLLARFGAGDIGRFVSIGSAAPYSLKWFLLPDGTALAVRSMSRGGREVVVSIDRGPVGAGYGDKTKWRPTTVKSVDLRPFAAQWGKPVKGLRCRVFTLPGFDGAGLGLRAPRIGFEIQNVSGEEMEVPEGLGLRLAVGVQIRGASGGSQVLRGLGVGKGPRFGAGNVKPGAISSTVLSLLTDGKVERPLATGDYSVRAGFPWGKHRALLPERLRPYAALRSNVITVKVDLAGPRRCWSALLEAMKAGDAGRVRALCTPGGYATLERVEKDFKSLGGSWSRMEVRWGREASSRASASLGPEVKAHGLEFRKIDGKWRLERWRPGK